MTTHVLASAAMRGAFSLLIASTTAAGCLSPPPDVEFDAAPVQGQVGGAVAGLWDGATLRLRIVSGGVDEELDVTAEGAFEFEPVLGAGATYEVTIARQPALHDCTLAMAGGTINGDVTDVAVTCAGPAVDVTLSMPVEFSFDPVLPTQRLELSVAQQQTEISVTAPDATEIRISSVLVDSGQSLGPFALALGENSFAIEVHVDELSRAYTLQFDRGAAIVERYVYGKASNTGTADEFGAAVAASGDVLVVGAPFEDSGSTGVNGNEGDGGPLFVDAGAAYVFRRVSGVWVQEAYLKAAYPGTLDQFGASVAVSGDTIVVGAWAEDSPAVGVNPNPGTDPSTNFDSGAVYVFRRASGVWAPEAYLKASNTGQADTFGWSVTISGETLVVSANLEDSDAIGVGGNEASNALLNAGAAYVFTRVGSAWSQQAYLKASNPGEQDQFGCDVDLHGELLVVGACLEDSGATGVNGDQSDNTEQSSGAAYAFRRVGSVWSQEAYFKASNTDTGDFFGASVAVDGERIAVGAPFEDGGAQRSGAAYVFERTGGVWQYAAYLKPTTAIADAELGRSVDLQGDVVVGGAKSRSVPGSETGRAYLSVRTSGVWQTPSPLAVDDAGGSDYIGEAVAITAYGIVVGAPGEDSQGSGINSGQGADNTVADSGAFHLFR